MDATLDKYERHVLTRLCREGRSPSSVSLAESLYGPGHALGWVVTENILEHLDQLGLVVYALGERDVFIRIRPTQKAYDALGIERRHARVIGERSSRLDLPDRPGDLTEFREHPSHAWGGAIERQPLSVHMLIYPEHADLHVRQSQEVDEMKAALSEETLAAISSRRDAGETPQQIAEALGLGVSTVYAKLRKRPSGSLRQGIVEELTRHGPADDTDDLIARMREHGLGRPNVSAHEVQHILHALRQQGLVSYRGDQNGNVVLLKAITARGVPRPEAPARQTEGVASSVAVPQGPVLGPQPEAVAGPRLAWYPELERLRKASVASERYLQAAALLEDVPGADDTVAALFEAAATADRLTAAEREYLQYAEEHE